MSISQAHKCSALVFPRQADKLAISILELREGFSGLLQVFRGLLTSVLTEYHPQDSYFVFYFFGEIIMFQFCWDIPLTQYRFFFALLGIEEENVANC